MCEIFAVTGNQPHTRSIAPRQDSKSVVFNFVQPSSARAGTLSRHAGLIGTAPQRVESEAARSKPSQLRSASLSQCANCGRSVTQKQQENADQHGRDRFGDVHPFPAGRQGQARNPYGDNFCAQLRQVVDESCEHCRVLPNSALTSSYATQLQL